MSEQLNDPLAEAARQYLLMAPSWNTEEQRWRHLDNSLHALFLYLNRQRLEAQSPPAETQQSGLTSPESGGASPETSTESPSTASTSAPTSSPSERGLPSGVAESRRWQAERSRTTAPISSTPATDRSTGPSASIDEALDIFETSLDLFRTGAITESTCLNRIYGAMSKLHRIHRPPTSPAEDASREGREAAEDFANDLCVNLDIEPFSEEGERMQAAVIRTWTEQGYPHGGPR